MSSERDYNLHRDAYGWRSALATVVASNAIASYVNPKKGCKTQIGVMSVLDSTGANCNVIVESGGQKIYGQALTAGTDFYSNNVIAPLVALSSADTIAVIAGNSLTDGDVYYTYRQIPD